MGATENLNDSSDPTVDLEMRGSRSGLKLTEGPEVFD